MAAGLEFYDREQRLMFNGAAPPFIYLGAVYAGTSIGALQNSTARNQDGLAPTLNPPVELCTLQVPANSILMAVTGNKCPTESVIYQNSSNGLWYVNFYGLRNNASTLYFFGRHPGTTQTNAGVEIRHPTTQQVVWDTTVKAMRTITRITEGGAVSIPSGKSYAVVNLNYGIGRGPAYQGPSSQGGRTYVQFLINSGYTDGATAGFQRYTRDIVQAMSGDNDVTVTYRNANAMIVDVTGY